MYTKDFIEKIISDNENEKTVILLEGSQSNGLASSSSNSIVIHPENGKEWETIDFKIEDDVIYVENKRTVNENYSTHVKTHIKKYAFLQQVIGVNVVIRDF